MCHTTLNTHLICLHTTSSTTKCTAASGYLVPTFISLLFSPPKCTKTSSKEYTDAFCSTCIEIFKQYSINEQETRARILRYREKNSYYGALTPFANEDGKVEFLKNKTNARQPEYGLGERTGSMVMVMEMEMGRKRRGSSLRGGGAMNHLLLLRKMMTLSQDPLKYRGRDEALILRRARSGLVLGQVLRKLLLLLQILLLIKG